MKYLKYMKYIFIVLLCLFSFYFSDQAILMVQESSPIMKQIRSLNDYGTEPVNAEIISDTIIPGSSGTKINERKSFLKMNEFGTFNETFLVYDHIKPEISLYDNLDKVIIDTKKKNNVALIIDSDFYHEDYFKEEGIIYTKVIKDIDEVDDNTHYINGNNRDKEFIKLNSYLKKNKINDQICLIGTSNRGLCQKFSYFLVKPTSIIRHSNIASYKSMINGGNIIKLDKSININELKIIISYIKYKNLSIISLRDLIEE